MTDYALSAADRSTMLAAFQAVGIANAEGQIRNQGRFDDGTEWALLDWGPRWFAADAKLETDGRYWVLLRWNGAAPTPPLPPGILISWSSADENAGAYPAGLPTFA